MAIFHILMHGRAKCGFSKESPDTWPEVHKWVRSGDELANCPECIAVDNTDKRTLGIKNFDADLSSEHPTNQEAARARGLRWSTKNGGCWVGSGGELVRDRFGQPY